MKKQFFIMKEILFINLYGGFLNIKKWEIWLLKVWFNNSNCGYERTIKNYNIKIIITKVGKINNTQYNSQNSKKKRKRKKKLFYLKEIFNTKFISIII
jgi:hypothetical protein